MYLKRVLFLICVVILLLGGCGSKEKSESEQNTMEKQTEANHFYYAEEDLRWEDNSLDEYCASFCYELELERPVGEYFGYLNKPCFGKTRFCMFRNFISPEEDTINQFTVVTDEGVHFREEITGSGKSSTAKENMESRICCVGSVLGLDQYAVAIVDIESQEDGQSLFLYRLAIWNENFEAKETIDIQGLDSLVYYNIDDILVDRQGRIHMTGRLFEQGIESFGEESSCKYIYMVADNKGELLQYFELNGENRNGKNYLYPSLCPFYDGRVGLACRFEHENNGKTELGLDLVYFDPTNGEETLISSNPEAPMDCTLWSEDRILFANGTGIYLSDLSWQNARPLYLWKNHSFGITDVKLFLDYDGEREINLFCRRNEEIFYRRLIPTTKEVSISEINFAIKGYVTEKHEKFVKYFNQKYPACKVNLITDYTDTKLNTELIAGEGPVLIDSLLTGFDDKVKYWEPLDDFLEITGLSDVIYEPILEAGRIQGKTYGVITDFGIDTVLTRDLSIDSATWNYEKFIEYVKKHKDCEAIFAPNGNPSGMVLFSWFFTNNLENSYWLKQNTNGTLVDIDHLNQIFNFIDTYCTDFKTNYNKEEIDNGKVLFRTSYIAGIDDLYRDAEEQGTEDLCIGYPSEDGAVQYMVYGYPIVIRSTATDEEKRVAYLFLREYLSYEGQLAVDKASINFKISVRRDTIEEQIRQSRMKMMELEAYGLTVEQQEEMRRQLDRAEARFLEILSVAKPKTILPEQFNDILWEEVYGYIEGKITREMAIEHFCNRVELFLNE